MNEYFLGKNKNNKWKQRNHIKHIRLEARFRNFFSFCSLVGGVSANLLQECGFLRVTYQWKQGVRLIKQSRHISTTTHPISRSLLWDIVNRIITRRNRKLLRPPKLIHNDPPPPYFANLIALWVSQPDFFQRIFILFISCLFLYT